MLDVGALHQNIAVLGLCGLSSGIGKAKPAIVKTSILFGAHQLYRSLQPCGFPLKKWSLCKKVHHLLTPMRVAGVGCSTKKGGVDLGSISATFVGPGLEI